MPLAVKFDLGSLFVVGTTAYAAVRAVKLVPDDTVVVSGAAGGVGSLAVQLATEAGATVIGLASPGHHQWLASHGVIPVVYGDGAAERVRKASDGRVDAFIDTFGGGYVEMAIGLRAAPQTLIAIGAETLAGLLLGVAMFAGHTAVSHQIVTAPVESSSGRAVRDAA